MDTAFPTVVWRLCLGLCCAWALVSAAPRDSWLGCWGVCVWFFYCCVVFVLRSGFRGDSAIPGRGLGCVSLGSGFGFAPPFLAGSRGVCFWGWVRRLPRHSWLGSRVCVSGHGFWSRSAFPGGGSRCVCVGLGFACTPLCSGFGVGACGPLRAPHPFPATFWWGCLRRGGVWGLPWVGFVPPPPLLFFFCAAGGLCGFRPCRVLALWCPLLPVLVLGLLVSVCPSPFVWALPTFSSFFFVYPPHIQWGVCRRVRGVVSSGGLLLSVGCCRVWQGGPPVFFRGALWMSPSVLPGSGFACLFWCGCVASRLCVCLLPPPFFLSVLFVCFLFFVWGGFACSSPCVP